MSNHIGGKLKRKPVAKKNVLVFFLLILIILIAFFIKRNYFNYSKPVSSIAENISDKEQTVSTIILPSSDIASSKITEFFDQLSKENPETIIYVTANQTEDDSDKIIINKSSIEFSENSLTINEKMAKELVSAGVVTSDSSKIGDQLGVGNNLKTITTNYKEAKIIPLIVGSKVEGNNLSKLNDSLIKECSNKCLMIISTDISRNIPGSLAEFQDDHTISLLSKLNGQELLNSNTDFSRTLYLGSLWAKSNSTLNFNLFYSSNTEKDKNILGADATGYIIGSFQNESPSKTSDVTTFLIGGDMMFDRYIDYKFRGDRLYDVVSNLGKGLFANTDLSMVNLEGPISETEIPADNTANNMIFNFPPKSIDVLKWLNINAVSLANNHTNNNGGKGLLYTKKVLKENNIVPIGQKNIFNENSISHFKSGTKNITVMTINVLETNIDLTEKIKAEKLSNSFVIIFPHWGTEYDQIHSESQEILAHIWIDAGADLVIGSHPHVIQDAEEYKGKPIFYSLGNLLFDQFFSKETQRGLIVAGEIKNDKLKLILLPTISKNLKPELLVGDDKTELLKKFRKYLGANTNSSEYGYDIIEM